MNQRETNMKKKIKIKLVDKKKFERIVQLDEVTHFIHYPLINGKMLKFEYEGHIKGIPTYNEI